MADLAFFSDAPLRRLAADSGFRIDRVDHLGRVCCLWVAALVAMRLR